MRTLFIALIIAALVQLAAWLAGGERIALGTGGIGKVASLSYAPYKGFDHRTLSAQELERDFDILSHLTTKVRTYSVTDALLIAPYLQKHRMRLDLGLWIGENSADNLKEIAAAREFLRRYQPLVNVIIVGNEALLREEVDVARLTAYINQVKQMSGLPVTTAEVWHIWNAHPELAAAVDLIMVHLLPYWERIDAHEALAFVKSHFEALRSRYGEKPVVIGEFGWPSRGYNNRSAKATLENEITLLGDFIRLAQREQWDYNIVEAFDQPWKGVNEGSVGPYWGLYNANREPKFRFDAVTVINPYWPYQMVLALLAGAFLGFFGLRDQRVNLQHALTYALASQAMGFGISMAALYPFVNYMNTGTWIMWLMGILLMLPLVITTLAKVNELFQCTLGCAPERLVPLNLASRHVPFVSIHVPAYKEQPHVLIETLEALSRLNYTEYEVLVIINNTPEPFYWEPIKACCERLGERFVYMNITCTGFKAGALNVALEQINPRTEIIAVIDADYVVSPAWLVDLVPLFEDPKVALVQAPQDHRDGGESLIKQAMNSEYMGFFDIGMVVRNEENAIVVHGTMLMVRLNAMLEVGGWGTDTIVEDSELGLRLFEAGYAAHYTNRRYGWGLLPDTIEAFKNQRHRWAYGAIQILKKHWRHFHPDATTLTRAQKHHFITGWLLWLFDALGPLMAILNIIWVPVIVFVGVTIPTLPLTLPIITAFGVNVLHAFILYRHRVRADFKSSLLSAIAAMSLQLIIFKAVFDGFIKDGLPFKRTEKGGNTKKRTANPVFYETILGAALLAGALLLLVTNSNGILEVQVFALTLLVQAVPYGSAVLLRRIELYGGRP